MSKVAEYLQEHILGEVVSHSPILEAMSHDQSVLEVRPEMVIYPRVTNDIRKVARFAWQLAEKGHAFSITTRGGGTDTTGGAIGKGIILSTKAHMNNILEFDSKQKLIRVQPGLETKALNTALSLHGLTIPVCLDSSQYSTVGGSVGKNIRGRLSGRYGNMLAWTHQLEVVLANGDILQTERISKRELNKRKGLQTLEGEIYRSIDNLIEDNKQLIDERIGADSIDTSGYSAIAKVKQKDGSFDLTPLFVGSQGTLGIVSEMILKCDFVSTHSGVIVATFTSRETARDALDQLREFEPAFLDYFDGELFEIAARAGKRYNFPDSVDGMVSAVVAFGVNDFNERARHKKLKKVAKALEKAGVAYQVSDGGDAEELASILDVGSYALLLSEKGMSTPPLFDGAYLPVPRFEEFSTAVQELAQKHHIVLPLHLRALDNTVYTRPNLQFHKVSDKQKILKLLDEYAALVAYYGGALVTGEEGRLKARFAAAQLDDDVKELYAAVKSIFDPYGVLNIGVKQSVEIRELVAMLRKEYDIGAFKDEVPTL